MAGVDSKQLKEDKEKILQLWEQRALKEVSSAKNSSGLVLQDSLPLYLDHLSDALATNRKMDARSVYYHDQKAARIGKLHGADRANSTGYILTEVIFEYHILREVIFQVLEVNGTLDPIQRDIVLDSIEQAVNDAAVKFSETHEEVQRTYASTMAFERHKLEIIFQESNAAMALWRGSQLIFEMVNPGFQAIFEGRQLLGKTFIEAAPEMVHQEFPGLLQKVYETGEAFEGHEVLARIRKSPGGALEDRYFDFKYVRVNDSEGNAYGVYDHAVDVTDRVQGRRDLEVSKGQLEQTVGDLVKERDLREQFVATLTHDLKNPITAAKMSAEIVMRDPGTSEASVKLIRKAVGSLSRLGAMIHDLLDVSRIRAGEPLSLQLDQGDLKVILREVVNEMTVIHGDRFILDSKASVEGCWDCDALTRTFENLIGNAVKYGAPDTPIKIALESSGTAAIVSIHNEGPPIAADELPLLFQQYRRSKGAKDCGKPGWGLGLTLVKGVVDAHKGMIRVESAEGKGTSFILEVPLSQTFASNELKNAG